MHFNIKKNPNTTGHKYWWQLVGENNKVMGHSEMLSSKQACTNAIRSIMDNAASAAIWDDTGETRTMDLDDRRVML